MQNKLISRPGNFAIFYYYFSALSPQPSALKSCLLDLLVESNQLTKKGSGGPVSPLSGSEELVGSESMLLEDLLKHLLQLLLPLIPIPCFRL